MKPLTAKEKALFINMDVPVKICGERMTRSVVVTYFDGKVIGIDSITAWRRFMKRGSNNLEYTYELRNMWL